MEAPMQRFDLIQRMLFSKDARGLDNVLADPLLKRLCGVLDAIEAQVEAETMSDLIVLIKQAFLSCNLSGTEQLRVPLTEGWPTQKSWQAFGFEVSPAGVGALLVRTQQWKPAWLDAGAPQVVSDAIQRLHRRPDRRVPSDPFLESKLDTPAYLSPSQRTAVRAAFLMPRGATALIVLPTGSGKSLVFQSPLFSSAFQSGLSVVVVPTVALAKDQDLRFQALSNRLTSDTGTFAYHSGMSDEEKRTTRQR
jgi:Distinct helicase family with a unique C-terminal domain including a metal-binding cysteine cluster